RSRRFRRARLPRAGRQSGETPRESDRLRVGLLPTLSSTAGDIQTLISPVEPPSDSQAEACATIKNVRSIPRTTSAPTAFPAPLPGSPAAPAPTCARAERTPRSTPPPAPG